jgi:DNA modification methylase
MVNTIINGDCFDHLKRIDSNTVDLILIDPPYQISKSSGFTKYSDNTSDELKSKYGKLSIDFGNWDKSEIDWNLLFNEYYRVLKKGGTLITFFDIWKSSIIKEAAELSKFKQPRVCSWTKCLSGSTEIYVRNSKKEHLKMFIKDLYRHTNHNSLELWDGEKWNRLVNIIKNDDPNKRRFSIKLKSGEIIKATDEHIFITNDNLEIKTIDLKKGDILKKCKLPDTDSKKDFSMLSHNMAWFIGLYLAEGSMSNRKIQISSNSNEEHRIDMISKLCSEYDGSFYVFRKKDTNSMTINVSSIIIESFLNKYLSGTDCYSKSFSKSFWNLNNNIMNIILLSYLEADGGKDLSNNRYRVGFTGKNRQLERDLRTICSRLGYRPSMRFCKIRNTTTNKIHSVIKGSIYLSEIGKRLNTSEITEITEITSNEKTNYFDITLSEKPNLFSLSSGILIHNCNPVPVNSKLNYLSNAVEYFFTFTKVSKPTFNSEYDNGVYKYPICHGKERYEHPTQKPLELMKDLIKKHSNVGDLVLDTFAGTGTTGHAAILLDRKYILVEKDENYFEIIKKRLEEVNKVDM